MDEKLRILLVEDDPEDTLFLVDALNRAMGASLKFDLECVDRLATGVEKLASGEFDIILLDLMLPDSRDLETLLRARASAPGTPIVVLSGLGDSAVAVEAMRHGAQDFLVKGRIDEGSLVRALRYALERHRLLAQMESILNRAADGLVVVDHLGYARYANPAAEALLGRKPKELLHRPFPYEMAAGRSGELELTASDGSRSWAQMQVREFEWRGRPAWLACIRDLTAVRKAEQLRGEIRERRRAEKSHDHFVGAVSREMRHPVAYLQACLGQLLDPSRDPLSAEQTAILERALRSAEMLLRYIGKLGSWTQTPLRSPPALPR